MAVARIVAYDATTGAPKTGLAPTWYAAYDVGTGADLSATATAPSELADGIYLCNPGTGACGVVDFGASANPRYVGVNPDGAAVLFAFDGGGVPLAGLAPAWSSYIDATTGLALVPQPTFTAFGKGVYRADSPGTNAVGVVDFGVTALPQYDELDNVQAAAAAAAAAPTVVKRVADTLTPLWQPATVYVVADGVLNAGALYRCITAGTSSAVSGPTGTAADITDGTAHWAWVKQAWGLFPQGFVSKPLTQVKADLDAAFKGTILGESAGTEADGSIPAASFAGQIIAAMADALAAEWDLAQAVYQAFDPGQATDAAQDALCSLTGTSRSAASYSTVTGTCTGTPGTVIPVASAATVTDTLARFATTAAATIAAATAYVGGANQVVGDIRTVGSSVYRCTSAGANGGTLDGTQRGSYVDGGATWRYLGAGTGYVNASFQAALVGPIAANAGTLTTIATPVFGWNGLYNVSDATQGAYLESSSHLRVKREAELHGDGNAAADAIRAKVLAVVDATSGKSPTACMVFVNDTDATDSNGVPPHGVLVLADYAGNDDNSTLDQAIAQAIWDAVGAGIATAGSTIATVTDDAGASQTVHWQRPTQVNIYVVASVTYDSTAGVFPSTGATDLADAIATYGDTFVAGKDVRAAALVAAIFDGPTSSDAGATAVPGILDASVDIGTAPAPGTSTPITIDALHRAVFDTSRITVNLTGATP